MFGMTGTKVKRSLKVGEPGTEGEGESEYS